MSEPHTIHGGKDQLQADLEFLHGLAWDPAALEARLLDSHLDWTTLYGTTALGALARIEWKLAAAGAGALHVNPERLFNSYLRDFVSKLDDEDYDALDPSIQDVARRPGRDRSDPTECW